MKERDVNNLAPRGGGMRNFRFSKREVYNLVLVGFLAVVVFGFLIVSHHSSSADDTEHPAANVTFEVDGEIRTLQSIPSGQQYFSNKTRSYSSHSPVLGHSIDNVWVSIDSNNPDEEEELFLLDALKQNRKITKTGFTHYSDTPPSGGSFHYATEIIFNDGDSLQDKINLDGELDCVRDEGQECSRFLLGNGRTRCDGSCEIINRLVNGTCDESVINGCTDERTLHNIPNNKTYYLWECNGINGGTNDSCSKRIPINGECGTVNNDCITGDSHDIQDDTNYNWQCIGQHEGTTDDCSIPKCVHARCGQGAGNCSQGINVSQTLIWKGKPHESWEWTCAGTACGSNITCRDKITPGYDGICGSGQGSVPQYAAGASVVNDCHVGTPDPTEDEFNWVWYCNGVEGSNEDVYCLIEKTLDGLCGEYNHSRNKGTCLIGHPVTRERNVSHYIWVCLGLGEGEDTNCSALAGPVNGVCDNNVRNGCLNGINNSNAYPNTPTHYRWRCDGLNGGSDSVMCSKGIPVDGVCDESANNGCHNGTLHNLNDLTCTYQWQCNGQYGGSNSSLCTRSIPAQDGRCGTTNNHCIAGESRNTGNTNTQYRWYCDGTCGGSDSSICSVRITPVNGVCNNNFRNRCLRGSSNDNAYLDTTEEWKWRCDGLHGGSDSGMCRKNKPINGVCDESANNGCSKGTLNDTDDLDCTFQWYCNGQYGGRRSGLCTRSVPAQDGVCYTDSVNGCSAGTLNNTQNSSLYYEWYCDGTCGGSSSGLCRKRKCVPSYGSCGTENYTCSSGDPDSYSENVSYSLWRCSGNDCGSSTPCSAERLDICSCDNAVKDGCSGGSHCESSNESETNTHYTWNCGEDYYVKMNCQTEKPIKVKVCGSTLVSAGETSEFRISGPHELSQTATIPSDIAEGYVKLEGNGYGKVWHDNSVFTRFYVNSNRISNKEWYCPSGTCGTYANFNRSNTYVNSVYVRGGDVIKFSLYNDGHNCNCLGCGGCHKKIYSLTVKGCKYT